MEIGKTLRARTRAQWRAWLAKHHASEDEIWLVMHRKASGKAFVAYNDAVEEALCFGWIDSIKKKLDGDALAQRYSPRRKRSVLSAMNRERIVRLIEQGLMTPAGLAAVAHRFDAKSVTKTDGKWRVPPDILRELKADRETWRNFQAFPESYKRIRIGWIDGSRNRPDFFRKRLDYFLKMTKQNKRFGMVQ